MSACSVVLAFASAEARASSIGLSTLALTTDQATVDKLIAQLDAEKFDDRQAAQAQLLAIGKMSFENTKLIVDTLKALKPTSLEQMRRAEALQTDLIKLGWLTITINDLTETLTATAISLDPTATKITVSTDDEETLSVVDPFFQTIVGQTKMVCLAEAPRDERGLTPCSDVISFGQVRDSFGLRFSSDFEDSPVVSLNCDIIPNLVCLPEDGPRDLAKTIFGDQAGFLVLTVNSDPPIPEPKSLALVGIGVAMLAAHRRWRPARS